MVSRAQRQSVQDLKRQGAAVGKYVPKFDYVENKVLSSTFSNSIPYISNSEKVSMIKFAKQNSDLHEQESTADNTHHHTIPVFKEHPERPNPFQPQP